MLRHTLYDVMRPRRSLIAAAPLVLLSLTGGIALGAPGDTPQIVLLDPGTNAQAVAAAEEHRGNDVTAVYSTAIDGFAAQLSPADIARLQANPAVQSIEPDARVTIQAAPGNDAFAASQAITGLTGSVTGTTVEATRESGEPKPLSAWGNSGKSIWYSWTAPATGTVTFDTKGSIKSGSNSTAMDTLLAAYTGSALNALTVQSANDDADGALTSKITFGVTAGTTYRIVIDGYANTAGRTKLSWTLGVSVPANDNLADQQVISGSQGSITGTTTNATRESGEPNHGGSGVAHSIWYRWQAPANGNVTFSTAGSGFTTALAAYAHTGTMPSSAISATTSGSITFAATANTVYDIAIDGQAGAMGTTALGWNLTAPAVVAPSAPGWASPPVVVSGLRVNAYLTAPTSDGGAPITRYRVNCTPTGFGTAVQVNGDTTTVAMSGFTAGATYTCVAYAFNANNLTSPVSATSSPFTMPTAPGAPTAVTAVPQDTSAVVSWTPPASDGNTPITGYTVLASGSPTRQCTSSGATTCTVTGLTNGVPYTFSVRATNMVGTGSASAPSAAVTPRAPVIAPPADTTPAPAPSPTPTDPAAPTAPEPVVGPGLPQSREVLSWGLDRLDERARVMDGRFSAPLDGTGVTAYVVDTGIMADHSEFTGRVLSGVDEVGDGNGTADCNGHGTHVSGTIGGSTYGVAPMARIVAVRVLGCDGSGSVSDVIAGLDWIVRTHAAGQPAVANLSMGTPSSAALNAAVDRAVADGVTVTVAAGNENSDACSMSPANDSQAITVGATDDTDTRASFSNHGSCVTVFAPGVDIDSAWNTGPKDVETLSGTSMAAPHAAGVAALLLSGTPNATPSQVKQAITDSATTGVVGQAGAGSPNLLLFGASSTVPQAGAAPADNGQGAHQVTKPATPKIKKVRRNAKGQLVITLTAAKGATIKVYVGRKVVKTTTAPNTGKAFTITVAKRVAHGATITVRAANNAGTSGPTRAIHAP